MAFSVKKLRANLTKYFGIFYNYLLHGIYWGSVPAIVLYGILTKPYSPILLALWGWITGQHEEPQYDPMYGGMPPGYGMPAGM
jgi:hypothetical protein